MPPKKRPRQYTTLDRDYLGQDTIEALGGAHGPAGPLVFLAVILNAGKASSATVELRWATLAKESFVSVETAQAVVGECVRLDLLADYEDRPRGRFAATLTKASRWESWATGS